MMWVLSSYERMCAMKRFFAVVLVFGLLLAFTGCDFMDYTKATRLFNNEQYEEAYALYQQLGDYADSVAMTELCIQILDYGKAEEAYTTGDYAAALALYTDLGMYKDSPVKAIQSQYALGIACLEAGNYAEAAGWLQPLGSYEDNETYLLQAKWNWLCQYVADSAEPVMLTVTEGEQTETVSLEPAIGGGVLLVYRAQGHLLGLPYENEFTIPLNPDAEETVYTAIYRSTVVNAIEETATGSLPIGGFCADAHIPIDTFQVATTDAEGNVTISEDASNTMMVLGIIDRAKVVLSQQLVPLLESTGVSISPRDLGFLSLE